MVDEDRLTGEVEADAGAGQDHLHRPPGPHALLDHAHREPGRCALTLRRQAQRPPLLLLALRA